MFCNTQDIEVKVQYILHEGNSRVLPSNPRPLCLQAHGIWPRTKVLTCCLVCQISADYMKRGIFFSVYWSDIELKEELRKVFAQE